MLIAARSSDDSMWTAPPVLKLQDGSDSKCAKVTEGCERNQTSNNVLAEARVDGENLLQMSAPIIFHKRTVNHPSECGEMDRRG